MPVSGLIGVDWGGSNLRVFRFDRNGGVVQRRASKRGVATIDGGQFSEALGELIPDWTAEGAVNLTMCGMVGSRNGWAEAAYVACPTEMEAISSQCLSLATPFGPARIAPGLSVERNGVIDVMRGEETQMLGALPSADWRGAIVLPGTHSKWAAIETGRITGFRTWMTGELFALLREQSVLRLSMVEGVYDEAAFDLGAARGLDDPAITSLLFTARTEALFQRISAGAAPSYLSGLLIGAEIWGALRGHDRDRPILVVGETGLARRYARVLASAGCGDFTIVEGEAAAARGLWLLDRSRDGITR